VNGTKEATMKAGMATLISSLVLALVACTPQREAAVAPVDVGAEKVAVEGVIGQLWESWESEDLELLSRIVAHDPDMVTLGTDAGERWVGWEAFRDSMQKQLEAFESIEVSPVEQAVKVHRDGAVAWFSDVVDMKVVTASGEAAEMKGTRVTGVLEKRDGSWLIVQIHVSLPVAGQAVEY
jgi:uncharacterized protein (TIGR02246 family)